MNGGRGRSAVDTVVVESGTSSSVGCVLGNRYVEGRSEVQFCVLKIETEIDRAMKYTKLRQSTSTSPLHSVNDTTVSVIR